MHGPRCPRWRGRRAISAENTLADAPLHFLLSISSDTIPILRLATHQLTGLGHALGLFPISPLDLRVTVLYFILYIPGLVLTRVGTWEIAQGELSLLQGSRGLPVRCRARPAHACACATGCACACSAPSRPRRRRARRDDKEVCGCVI